MGSRSVAGVDSNISRRSNSTRLVSHVFTICPTERFVTLLILTHDSATTCAIMNETPSLISPRQVIRNYVLAPGAPKRIQMAKSNQPGIGYRP